MEGQIGAGQLKVITEAMIPMPSSVPESARERLEADLADTPATPTPVGLRIITQRMLDLTGR